MSFTAVIELISRTSDVYRRRNTGTRPPTLSCRGKHFLFLYPKLLTSPERIQQ